VSRERLLEHRRIWEEKPSLAEVYRPWFEALLAEIPPRGRALEVGAGPGFLAEYARRKRADARLLAMDVLQVPWNDLVGDGLRLPVGTGRLDTVLGLDLVHHLDQGDGVLVLTDIYGATPGNIALKLLKPGRVEGIAGVNLPMLIRALTHREQGLAVVVEKALSGAAEGVIHMTKDSCAQR
jgi:hypothetical protein